MKRLFNLLLPCLVLLTYCGVPTSMRDAALRSLLPGECLDDTELEANPVEYRVSEKYISFSFKLPLSHHELVNRSSHLWSHDKDDLPTADLFDSFGTNKKEVQDAYMTAYDSFFDISEGPFFGQAPYTTILYTGNFSLTADKEFAGIPAGEDLSCLVHSGYGEACPVLSSFYSSREETAAILSIPYDYICLLETSIWFVIPVVDHSVTNENVTFHIDVPVRVIQYLHWLNERLASPNAEPPYYDTVLHTTFTSGIGLD